jgi:hypothetical protein
VAGGVASGVAVLFAKKVQNPDAQMALSDNDWFQQGKKGHSFHRSPDLERLKSPETMK